MSRKKSRASKRAVALNVPSMTETHELIRAVEVAHYNLGIVVGNYRKTPTDEHARDYANCWKKLRATVDALVKHEVPGSEELWLAK